MGTLFLHRFATKKKRLPVVITFKGEKSILEKHKTEKGNVLLDPIQWRRREKEALMMGKEILGFFYFL